MELCTHHIVVVTCKDGDASSRLPVPYTYGLIIRGTENPRVLVMELNSSDVIQMPEKVEQAPSGLVVPYFDLVVISTRDEKRLCGMERDSANGTVVLLELVNERSVSVVPELDDSGVETGKDPGPSRVETQSLHSLALRLEFGEHFGLPKSLSLSPPAMKERERWGYNLNLV